MDTWRFKEDLKTWMEKNQARIADVAAKTGISVRTIYRVLEGEGSPSPLVKEKLLKLFKTAES